VGRQERLRGVRTRTYPGRDRRGIPRQALRIRPPQQRTVSASAWHARRAPVGTVSPAGTARQRGRRQIRMAAGVGGQEGSGVRGTDLPAGHRRKSAPFTRPIRILLSSAPARSTPTPTAATRPPTATTSAVSAWRGAPSAASTPVPWCLCRVPDQLADLPKPERERVARSELKLLDYLDRLVRRGSWPTRQLGNAIRTDTHARDLRERANDRDVIAAYSPGPLGTRFRRDAARLRALADACLPLFRATRCSLSSDVPLGATATPADTRSPGAFAIGEPGPALCRAQMVTDYECASRSGTGRGVARACLRVAGAPSPGPG
jgi:hypothetical protein